MTIEYKAWPFQQAQLIEEKLAKRPSDKPILFETGFGPSGLPHIGTFSEVARTTWVQRAFQARNPGVATKLYAFSDDMDGLRKIPENVPNHDLIRPHLGRPLCDIPDPFGEEESFSGYMNAKLRSFLDHFGFEYEFKSSKDQYREGVFNDGLLQILNHYEAVRQVILPTLGQKKGDDEDKSTWSPFMPICSQCGKVYTTRVTDIYAESGEIHYVCDQSFRGIDACGHQERTSITDGRVKVGWKVDWALRWYVFGVDYEMYGKDLIESAELSSKIVKVLGGEPPAGFFYEMFLDENGAKISKSVGRGLTIDEWLKYGPLESLGWFVYQTPTKAKKLYFDVIPRCVDDWLDARSRYASESEEERVNNPAYFLHAEEIDAGASIGYKAELSFSVLLNLVNVLNTDDRDIIWNYVLRYDEQAKEEEQTMDALIGRAIAYFRDFVAPTKEFALPDDSFRPAVDQLLAFLDDYDGNDSEVIQSQTYAAGKENGLALGKWFAAMYRLLLGQERGPRLGTFIALYGVKDTAELIRRRYEELG